MTDDEKRTYLLTQEGWREMYLDGLGMRWIFFSKDKRRRTSDDYSLAMAYDIAKAGK